MGIGADVDRHLPVLVARSGRHDNHWRLLSLGPASQSLDDLKAVELWHFQVGDNQLVTRSGCFSPTSHASQRAVSTVGIPVASMAARAALIRSTASSNS